MAGRTKHPTSFARRSRWLLLSAALGVSAQYAWAAEDKAINFTIPAQKASVALDAFARQSGWQVGYAAGVAGARRTQTVAGVMSPDAALIAMLAGTGLHIRKTGPTSVALVTEETMAAKVPAEDGNLLDPIVIAGKKGDIEAGDAPYATPGSVSHISGEQIQRTPPTSVGDMFKSAPGVIASGNRVGGSMDINIRGLQGQNRVNVMVDGTRQTNHTYRGYRGSRNEVYVDPDFIGGIDITKGPNATAGGVGAMGGVVNMRLIEAGDIVASGKTVGARVKAGLGTNTIAPKDANATGMRSDAPGFNGEAWSGSAIAAAITDDYEVVAGLSRRKAGNYFAGTNGKDTFWDDRVPWSTPVERPLSPIGPGKEVFNTSQDVTSFLGKGKIKWGDGHSLGLGYTYYDNEYGEFDETLLLFAQSGPFAIPVTQYELSETTTHTVKSAYGYKPEHNDYFDLNANLWFTHLKSSSGVIKAYSGASKTTAETLGGDIANRSVFDTPFGRLNVGYGGEFVFEKAREDAAPVSPGNPFFLGANPNGDRLLLSAFSHTKLEVTDWLAVAGGLRYDYYESEGKGELANEVKKEGDRVNPSVSVTLEPFEGIQLFAAYVEGWRPPSLRETAARMTAYLVPNPNLDPELSRNFEFGLNILRNDVLIAGDSFRFKAVRFDNSYDDYILRKRRFDGLYSWDNIDKAVFRGYELSAAYDAGYAFLEGTFTKYDHIQFCDEPTSSYGRCDLSAAGQDYGLMSIPPEYSGSVTAGVRLFEERLTFGGRAYFFGERYGGYKLLVGAVNTPIYYPENTIFDLFASYRVTEDLTLDLSAENISDEYYLDPLSTGLIPSPGRTIKASLTANF